MAELTADPVPTSTCCSRETQASCCEPSEKSACCGSGAADGSCGCAAGRSSDPQPEADIRETVRRRYAQAARAVEQHTVSASCGCNAQSADLSSGGVFGASLYETNEVTGATAESVQASLGCGVPTTVADLHEGETVLDLGSGAGADVLISAHRVGATGKAIGLDMTDEMLELARRNANRAGVTNVEFVKGYIEEIPLPSASVDVVISNCVINLAADKQKVLLETARVLRPGGRLAISDVIAAPGMDDNTRADMQAWTGCIAGALTENAFRAALDRAGLVDVEVRATHKVHEHAEAAVIRARKPTVV
jgi:arsenite methyltransferase